MGKSKIVLFVISCVITLTACQGPSSGTPSKIDLIDKKDRKFTGMGKLFGGVMLFKGPTAPVISPMLWEKTLHVLSAFPLEKLDAKNGIIRTQWITATEHPQHRFQIQVLVLPCHDIRTEALRVFVSHQSQNNQQWCDCAPSHTLAYKIKEVILLKTRACLAQHKAL